MILQLHKKSIWLRSSAACSAPRLCVATVLLAAQRTTGTVCKVAAARPSLLATRLVVAKVAKPSSPAPDSDDSAVGSTSSPGARDQPGLAAEPAAADAVTSITAGDVPADGSPPLAGAAGGSVPAAPSLGAAGGGGGAAGGVQGSPSAAVSSGGASGGQSAVALLTRFNGIGYTFVLAGFLKIVTLGGLASSAPVDMARTSLGKASPYLMVPVGLGLCWIAKQVVDSGLHESKRFLQYMVGVLVLLYFGLVKLLYKYVPDGEWVRRPRPRLPGRMSELRAQLGDRDLLGGAGSVADSRSYQLEKPGKELYDDLAWYEGRYPSQLAAAGAAAGRQPAAAGRAYMSSRAAAAGAASDTEEEYASAVDDILRARGVMGGDAAGNEGRPLQARPAAARRSFLSDNQQR